MNTEEKDMMTEQSEIEETEVTPKEKKTESKFLRLTPHQKKVVEDYCKSLGVKEAQGWDHVIEVMEINLLKEAVPGRLVEIEAFEKLTKDILAAYINSVEIYDNTESLVREQFETDLKSKERTISDLQSKVDQLKEEKEDAEQKMAESVRDKEQAEKDLAVAEKEREAAVTSASDKAMLADNLMKQLEAAEFKAAQYDEIKERLESTEDALKNAEQQIKDNKRDADEAAREAARNAEKAVEEAVRKTEAPLLTKIEGLKDQLRVSQGETESAKRDVELAVEKAVMAKEREMQAEIRASDRENARLQTRLEQLEAQLAEMQAKKERAEE